MKKIIFGLILLPFAFSSCSDDEEVGCKTCTAIVTQEVAGEVVSTTSMSASEFCDDDLETIEANPTTVITQEVGGVSQVVTTTYSCN